jgi:unsaturated rhamnogalacturonyl hydrolase
MKRKNFLKHASLISGSFILSSFIPESNLLHAKNKNQVDNNEIIKVKRAMLSMQRASWEHGVAMQAFLESGDEEMVILMAKEAALRQTSEGRLSVVYVDNGVTDPAASGEAVLYAAKVTGDKSLQEAAVKMLKYLLEKAPRSAKGIICHTLDAREIWVDSMYMAPPFLAAAGQYEESLKFVKGIRSYLWNEQHKLFSHRWSDSKNDFVNKSYWGVGNGWAMAGMSRVLGALPPNMKEEKELLIGYVKDVIDGCLQHLRPDYLFHNVIDDKTTFIETNLSQMVAYTIFRGVSEKWLDKKYLEYAINMRKAAHHKIDKYGYVQDVCGAPEFESPGRATEGQAFFLLMEAAYNKMMKS